MHILAKSLTKRYRDGNQSRAVLDGTDFAIDLSQGPVAITGASGSGKSTLLALLGGLDVPDDGTLRIGEFELSSMNGDQRSNFRLKTCGFIFQEFNLMGTLRVWENVALPAVFAGTSFTDVRERAYQLLEDVDCGDLKERLPHEISGGQMQRVAIARALINKPELILADEPTGNLDERSSKQVMSTLLQVASSGVGLVMVTHDPSIAQKMPQHFQVRDGHVVQEPK